MKSALWLCIGVLSLSIASLRPAHGCLEAKGREPVKLPMCVGERATIVLNRALRNIERDSPLRLETIDDAQQTNFVLNGTRTCAGSMTSQGGSHYTGTWSYTRMGDDTIRVIFSLQPSE